MTAPTSNVEIIRSVYDAMARADVDEVLRHCSPDSTLTQTPELPWGGHYVGRDGFLEFAITLTSTIESKVAHEEIFEAGDRVIQRGRTQGTVRATGTPFDVSEVHVWTFVGDTIVAAEFYIDTPAMLAALTAGT